MHYCLVLAQTSTEDVDDVDADGAPRALNDDHVAGVMNACQTGDVNELEKYVFADHRLRQILQSVCSLLEAPC